MKSAIDTRVRNKGGKAINRGRTRYCPPDSEEDCGTLTFGGSSNLKCANLKGVVLTEHDFCNVNFSGANLEKANLRDSKFYAANLKGVNLKGADLSGAWLEGANLEGADLRGACLRGAILADANLSGVKIDKRTAF